MAAISGTIDEWGEVEPNRWRREVDGAWVEEDGVLTLSDGVKFSDYWKKRAAETEEPVRNLAAEIDALKAKLAETDTKLASLQPKTTTR